MGIPKGPVGISCNLSMHAEKLKDSRFDDPSYLAARYVVFLASKFAAYKSKKRKASKRTFFGRIRRAWRAWRELCRVDSSEDSWSLDFLSVGVCGADPCDIGYRYVVTCGRDRPVVQCFQVWGTHATLVEGWEDKIS